MNITDVKNFGARGDGKANDTAALQNAIDICATEGRTLLISSGTYNTGTLFIRDNSDIRFEENAIISAIADLSVYHSASTFVDAVGRTRGKALIVFYEVKNIKISGKGMITGNGPDLKSDERPFLVRVDKSENITIQDIRLEHSPSWCLHIDKSKNIDIDNVTIYNRHCANNDGIDVDSSENVTVTNCDISSGDDGICIKTTSNLPCKNITVKNCRVSTDWGAFKIGTESVGDFENIFVSDCLFYDVFGGGIKIVPVDGANVNNVRINNIVMNNCTGPIFIANGERNREYAKEGRSALSTIKNIEISNITADIITAPEHGFYDGEIWGKALGGIILSGTVKNKLKNIVLTDMNLSLPGGYNGDIPVKVREMGKLYPEFHRFDPVPAKGIYIRHADGIKIHNIKMNFKAADSREEIYCDDTSNCQLDK